MSIFTDLARFCGETGSRSAQFVDSKLDVRERLLPAAPEPDDTVSSGDAAGTGRSTARPSLRAETQLERDSQQRGQAASRDDLRGTVQGRATSRGDLTAHRSIKA